MEPNRNVRQAVRYAITAVAAATTPTILHAQDQEGTAAPLEEIVVTGSRLRVEANDQSISPVSSITTQDIQATGLTRVEDVLNDLPQIFAAQQSTVSNGANGTATVNLRNLGARRTLVLVNGRRLGPGTPSNGSNASDLNVVPAALVERIDVLTGGASSVYGADAVAGVVNFVLNTKFEGIKLDANYSFNNHKNDNEVASIVRARGFPLPPSTVNTGYSRDFAVTMGSNFADDKGNAVFFATYNRTDPVTQGQYDFSSCVLNSPSAMGLATGARMACGGSATNATGYFQAYNAAFNQSLFTVTVDQSVPTGAFRNFSTATDLYNFGPPNYYQRPNERYTAGVFLNYDVSEKINTYAEFMFASNYSVAQIAPSGEFFSAYHRISCSNPLWSAAQRNFLCSPANLAAQGETDHISMYIGRRNVEGGGRQAIFDSKSYRGIVGVRGDINENWNFDVYGQYGTTTIGNQNANYLDNSKIARALDVVPGPGGVATCQSVIDRSDTACVPWNIWQPGGVTPAATSYLATPLLVAGDVTERVVSGNVSGDLGAYGVKLPSAESGMQINLGAEWRSEQLDFRPDAVSQAGTAAGAGGKTVPLNGAFTVKELFMEARLPLIDGKTGAQSLALETGYRFSDYNLGFSTDTYKVGLEWVPVEDLRLRASYQRAVRAPNIGELFFPQAVGLDGTTDPCAGAAPAFTLAQCARTGVTAAQYGSIGANPAAQYNGLLGGNPALKPEEADTYSVGFVYKPSFVENLTVSLDYFDIKVDKVIGPIGADVIISNCLTLGTPEFCSAVRRSASGSLWRSNDGYISDLNVNAGSLGSKGIDVKLRYKHGIGSLGSISYTLDGTYAKELFFQPVPGGAQFDCIGYYGSNCGVSNPKWRHVFKATWSTPWAGLDLALRWRHTGDVITEKASSDPQLSNRFYPETATFPKYNYLDLTASWTVKEKLDFRIGVNNLTDKDPPISVSGTFSTCPTTLCNGNTYPGVYDTLGRYVYMNASVKF
jgi:outer membrane receptor protein involved in Fe transport